jgi:signal transduction histidine kinase
MTLATDQLADSGDLSPTGQQFIAMRDTVMEHWERQVRARVDGARQLLRPVLTNTLPAFLDNIAEALSPDHPRKQGASGTNSASAHGGERARMTPYGPDQVIHEYQILRESIAVVGEGRVALTQSDWLIIDRSIDAAMREAVRSFTRIHEDLRHRVAAALSHDMRTPLSVVANGAHVLGMTSDLVKVRHVASRIASNADRLEDMIAELLDALTYQGAATIPLHLTRFDILDLMREAAAQYIHGDDNDVVVELSGEPVVGYWCRASMRRALENLINNAIKYGDRDTVKLMAHQTRGRLMLSVHNEGNPIPAEQHNRIFDYLRREAGPLAATGWGIGLPFVKAVGESHGGSVVVDSSPELGTTFLIDVPVDCRPFVEQPGAQSAAQLTAT